MSHKRQRRTPEPLDGTPRRTTKSTHGTLVRFLFVGDRPSIRAERIGATLENGRLSGKTLHQALQDLHLDPDAHRYLNLYARAQALDDLAAEDAACERITRYAREGYVVIGLGRLVSCRLSARSIPHLRMIHPAARGAIRRRECYRLHVATVLSRVGKEKG